MPDGYFIVNDSHRTRFAPLADSFGVRYIPEGNSRPVKAHNAQFLGWLGETTQSDFPPKETSWWWIDDRRRRGREGRTAVPALSRCIGLAVGARCADAAYGA